MIVDRTNTPTSIIPNPYPIISPSKITGSPKTTQILNIFVPTMFSIVKS